MLRGWIVAGLLLSQTVCFDHWQRLLPLHHCLAASWQRRCRRWLGNERIDPAALYGPLVLWAIQQWQKPGRTLHLALDTTVLWNRCEPLFRDQKSGIFQLENSRLQDPARLDRLLLVVAIAVLISSLQGYAVSLSGERRRVDSHWKRGLSFARIGLHWLQQSVITTGRALLPWLPIPLPTLEPWIPSRRIRQR